MLRSPGGSHGEEEGGLGRKRFSYPPFHRQSRRLQTGSENKSCYTWGDELQGAGKSQSSPRQGRPNPAFPSLPTHPLTLPQLQQGIEKSRGERRTRRVRNSNSPPPSVGIGLRRSEILQRAGRGSRRGWGSLTAVRPGRRLPASHHGPGGKGEKGRGASGVGVGFPPGAACSEPTRAEGRDRDCPSRPRERARLLSPARASWRRGGWVGRAPGAVPRCSESRLVDSDGGHRRNALSWPLAAWVSAEVSYWLRGSQPGWLLGAWGRCPPGPGFREWYLPPPST